MLYNFRIYATLLVFFFGITDIWGEKILWN